jgi:hypothetical protein
MTQENPNLQREEELLRKALRHENAPPDFAQQVMARAAAQSVASKRRVGTIPWQSLLFRPVVRWGAIAALAASLVVGAVRYHELKRERAEGEVAKQQLMLALHIAGAKLQLAKVKVNEINSTRPQTKPETSRSRSKS